MEGTSFMGELDKGSYFSYIYFILFFIKVGEWPLDLYNLINSLKIGSSKVFYFISSIFLGERDPIGFYFFILLYIFLFIWKIFIFNLFPCIKLVLISYKSLQESFVTTLLKFI